MSAQKGGGKKKIRGVLGNWNFVGRENNTGALGVGERRSPNYFWKKGGKKWSQGRPQVSCEWSSGKKKKGGVHIVAGLAQEEKRGKIPCLGGGGEGLQFVTETYGSIKKGKKGEGKRRKGLVCPSLGEKKGGKTT